MITLPTSGKVGETIQIPGDGSDGHDQRQLNGTAAEFEVVSGSLISATVPAGATTGCVTVTTSSTLKSNVKFRVQP